MNKPLHTLGLTVCFCVAAATTIGRVGEPTQLLHKACQESMVTAPSGSIGKAFQTQLCRGADASALVVAALHRDGVRR